MKSVFPAVPSCPSVPSSFVIMLAWDSNYNVVFERRWAWLFFLILLYFNTLEHKLSQIQDVVYIKFSENQVSQNAQSFLLHCWQRKSSIHSFVTVLHLWGPKAWLWLCHVFSKILSHRQELMHFIEVTTMVSIVFKSRWPWVKYGLMSWWFSLCEGPVDEGGTSWPSGKDDGWQRECFSCNGMIDLLWN